MEIVAGNVVYLLTDEQVYIKLDQIDSVRIHPTKDRENGFNVVRVTMAGHEFDATNNLSRSEAEAKVGEIINSQKTYIPGVSINAPAGQFEVKNLYVDSSTGRLVVEYSDVPVLGE